MATSAEHEFKVNDLVRLLGPGHPHRGKRKSESDIGEIQEQGLNPVTGCYYIRLLGHPIEADFQERHPRDLEVCIYAPLYSNCSNCSNWTVLKLANEP